MEKRQVAVTITSYQDGNVQITARPVGGEFTRQEVDQLERESDWLRRLDELLEAENGSYCSVEYNHAKATYSKKGTIENFEKFVLAIFGEVFDVIRLTREKP